MFFFYFVMYLFCHLRDKHDCCDVATQYSGRGKLLRAELRRPLKRDSFSREFIFKASRFKNLFSLIFSPITQIKSTAVNLFTLNGRSNLRLYRRHVGMKSQRGNLNSERLPRVAQIYFFFLPPNLTLKQIKLAGFRRFVWC